MIISDKGSHFSNELMKNLSKDLDYKHHFAISYCPWTNGTIEVRNSTILSHLKVILAEYGAHEEEWPEFLPIIQFTMNNTKMKSKGNLTPFQIFMGIDKTENYIQHAVLPTIRNKTVVQPLSPDKVKKEVEKVAQQLKEYRERAFKFTELARTLKLKSRNAKYNAIDVQFQVGDFVLLSRYGTKAIRKKTKLEWGGPFQIKEIHSSNVYTIQELTSEKTMKVHASRLWFYEPSGFVPTKAMKLLFDTQWKTLEVDHILELRIKSNQFLLHISWIGLEEIENSWEPLHVIYQTIPNTVEQFVRNLATQGREDAKMALQYIKDELNPPLKKTKVRTVKVETTLDILFQKLQLNRKLCNGNGLVYHVNDQPSLQHNPEEKAIACLYGGRPGQNCSTEDNSQVGVIVPCAPHEIIKGNVKGRHPTEGRPVNHVSLNIDVRDSTIRSLLDIIRASFGETFSSCWIISTSEDNVEFVKTILQTFTTTQFCGTVVVESKQNLIDTLCRRRFLDKQFKVHNCCLFSRSEQKIKEVLIATPASNMPFSGAMDVGTTDWRKTIFETVNAHLDIELRLNQELGRGKIRLYSTTRGSANLPLHSKHQA